MDLSTFKVGSAPWLVGVLHGSVSLPYASRDATIAMTVRDFVRKQDSETQKLFETSVGGLFLQLFDGVGPCTDDYFNSLCDLIVYFALRDVVNRVPAFVEDVEAFESRPFKQRVDMLHLITDLKIQVRDGFYQDLVARDPQYSIFGIGALIDDQTEEALKMLPLLADDPRLGTTLVVFWQLRVEDGVDYSAQLRELCPRCQPEIQRAITRMLGSGLTE